MRTFLERVLENVEEFPQKEIFVKKEKGQELGNCEDFSSQRFGKNEFLKASRNRE